MVQVSSPTVRVAKSDVQVGLGEVVPRSIMFDHTFIRVSNIDFQKIGSPVLSSNSKPLWKSEFVKITMKPIL